jgi:hypothetical protein
MACQSLADQRQSADINRFDAITRRSVLKEAVAAKLRDQLAAGRIDVAVIDVHRILLGPEVYLLGDTAMLLAEERPM